MMLALSEEDPALTNTSNATGKPEKGHMLLEVGSEGKEPTGQQKKGKKGQDGTDKRTCEPGNHYVKREIARSQTGKRRGTAQAAPK